MQPPFLRLTSQQHRTAQLWRTKPLHITTRSIRMDLRGKDYQVIENAANDLSARAKMVGHFFRLGRILLGKDKARDLRDSPTWFDHAGEG